MGGVDTSVTPQRCAWAGSAPAMVRYHDEEWGVPLHDDRRLFELLVLEGAQAGLSWSTILAKREAYRHAFARFDPRLVARFTAARLQRLLQDDGIVRNRAKVAATVVNARAMLALQRAEGSFDAWLWRHVGGRPIQNRWRVPRDVPAVTDEAQSLSRDLKAHGFAFVGPTICYAFMQAAGLVNDHLLGCFRRREVERLARS
jgi:DNA-3-methyladenine glycosylase I